MGWLSDKLFGKRKSIDPAKIAAMMKPSKDMMYAQIDMSRDLMDPNSQLNMRMRNLMAQRSAESGAQAAQQMQKMGAQTGMSPAQAMMQQRMAMNQSMGQGQQNYMQGLMGNQRFGGGLLSAGVGHQTGLSENMANAYMGNVNAHNARRGANMSMAGSILGGFIGSDKKLKENIELVGTSPKGYNIYEFDYKDKSYGEGRYRGVMAQEVPEASININGTLMVNYDKLDVDFERIS